jgi:DNA-binding transcriptional regulator LsrR (DeoR family)
VLAARIARRYYIDGASKTDIAAEFGLSRFKVARELERARASGLVRIELRHEGEIDLDLSVRLATRCGLRRCLVIDSADEDEALLRANLGRTAAELLSEVVTVDDVLGLAWSRTHLAMRSSLSSLAPCTLVQLTGALSRPDLDHSSIELVRDVARIAGGRAYWFYAPMIMSDGAGARMLRTQPEVARAFERFDELTKAVITIGAWARGQSTVADAITADDFDELARLGVCAELAGTHLDAEGRPLRTPLGERIVAIDPNQLAAVPEIIATAYGRQKAQAVRAAIRGGFVTTLITHAALAEELLQLP